MKIDLDRIEKDTEGLTPLQFGAYVRLLFHLYKGKPIPDDDKIINKLLKITMLKWMTAIKPAIRHLFSDTWTVKWVDEDLARAKLTHGRLSAAGKKGNYR
jgi:uncharacterized protein YdaU (DUF1376 family)